MTTQQPSLPLGKRPYLTGQQAPDHLNTKIIHLRRGGRCARYHRWAAPIGTPAPPKSARGQVVEFSRRSARRLAALVMSTQSNHKPLFVTLTYADEAVPDRGTHHRTAKRDLDVLLKRFRRAWPEASAVWRIEFRPRQSGVFLGELLPHYHLLVWGERSADVVKEYVYADWFRSNWYDIAGGGNEAHLEHGTDVQMIRSVRGTAAYVSKYLAKESALTLPEGVGRMWGVHNRRCLPTGDRVVIDASGVADDVVDHIMTSQAGDYRPSAMLPTWIMYVDADETILRLIAAGATVRWCTDDTMYWLDTEVPWEVSRRWSPCRVLMDDDRPTSPLPLPGFEGLLQDYE